MQAKFLTPLRVEQVSESDWRLIDPLVYWSEVLDRQIVIPENFVTDFASVPRMPFLYWFAGGSAEAPAVLHDWYYRTKTEEVTRAQADALLYEAIVAAGYWRIRAWTMWAGVRIGGYWSYETRPVYTTER